MSHSIESVLSATRDLDGAFGDERFARVRQGALRAREARIQHKKTLRRGIAAAGGVCMLTVMFLRAGALASPANGAGFASGANAGEHASDLLATRGFTASDDAGFTRD